MTKPLTYRQAHDKVRAQRGRADGYTCTDCDRQATDWSLKANTIADKVIVLDEGKAMEISPLPADYEPRCSRCHKQYDTRLAEEFEASLDWEPSPYEGYEG